LISGPIVFLRVIVEIIEILVHSRIGGDENEEYRISVEKEECPQVMISL
jgi:hypothetical protein